MAKGRVGAAERACGGLHGDVWCSRVGRSGAVGCFAQGRCHEARPGTSGCIGMMGEDVRWGGGGHMFGLRVDVGAHSEKCVDEVEMAFLRRQVEGGEAGLR